MRLIALFILLLACSMPALAFTISPAKLTFDTPGEHQFTITVNSEPGIARIRSQGDMQVLFDAAEKPVNGTVTFTGTLTIPEDAIPGDHTQQIIVSLDSEGNGFLAPTVELVTLLVARRRYEGPYLVANIYSTADQGAVDTAQVFISLENRGMSATTPTSMQLLSESITDITPQEIPGGATVPFTATLHGRGEQLVTLRIQGDAALEQNFTAVIGHPIITAFNATLIPEQGAITPVGVRAAVSWNRPVPVQLQVGEKTYDIADARDLDNTFYTESNATDIPVTIRIGSTTQTVTLTRAAVPVQKKSHMVYVLVALIVLGAAGYLWWRRIPR